MQGDRTVVECLESGKLICVVLQQPGKLPEENAALGTRGIQTPNSIESLLGGIDGSVDVLGGGFGNGHDDFSIR